MVSISRIIKCALRYDTVVACAFRRALGIKRAAEPVPKRGGPARREREWTDRREIMECFRNEGRSPVEWG